MGFGRGPGGGMPRHQGMLRQAVKTIGRTSGLGGGLAGGGNAGRMDGGFGGG